MNCASPPAVRAKGKSVKGVAAVPYQPARLAETMKVAAAKPNSPSTDGAATGVSVILVRSRQKVEAEASVAGRESFSVNICTCLQVLRRFPPRFIWVRDDVNIGPGARVLMGAERVAAH